MKVVFFEEWINLHNISILVELYNILGADFTCITPRLLIGDLSNNKMLPADLITDFSWVYETEKEEQSDKIVKKYIETADILISAEYIANIFREQIEKGKLVFLYGERIIKQGTLKAYDIRMILKYWKMSKVFMKKNVFLLCNSAYLPYDMSRYGLFKGKCLKWAYFSKLPVYQKEDLLQCKSHSGDPIQFMWAGRLSKASAWKHPELALQLMCRLKQRKVNCRLSVVGFGDNKENLKKLCTDMDIDDMVTFLDEMSMSEVSEYMKHMDIYLFTSDANEGWGVVLNEAMNAACCVIASDAAGATPFLVEHEKNGLTFKSMDIDDLEEKTMKVILNCDKRREYALAAHDTMDGLWSAKNAAQQLIQVCNEYINSGEMKFQKEGPCSLAEIIKG